MPHHHTQKKRLSRRFRKKLYRILTALNDFDFRRLCPLGIVFCAVFVLVLLCLLPTSRTDNLGSPEALCGEYLAESIRRTVSCSESTSSENGAYAADVVALFLSGEEIAAFSSGDTAPSFDVCTKKPLYSIYVTGEELYALAEGAVALFSAVPDTTIFLSGLSYTYHPLRLPLNRILELTFSDGSEVAKENDTLYHIISTEELFLLLHSLAYRSQGIMKVSPKDRNGILLSDYSNALLGTEGNPSFPDTALSAVLSKEQAPALSEAASVSVVTRLGGWNLITLLEQPNRIALYIALLLLAFIALLCYCIPRIRRVYLWIRIYAIHRRKRGYAAYQRKFFRRKKNGCRKTEW